MNLKSELLRPTAKKTTFLYSAIIFNIILGWIVAKLNTGYLTVEDYGKYSFFIIVVFFSRAFFSFGFFESTSRLLALPAHEQEHREWFGTTLFWTFIFIIPYSLFFFLIAPLFDMVFKVPIGEPLSLFAFAIGLILINSFLTLALRGSGQIGLLAFVTAAPRFFYILLLLPLIFYHKFTLNGSIVMFYAGLLVSSLILFIYIKPKFSSVRRQFPQLIQEVKTYGIHIYTSNCLHEIFFHSDKFLVSYFLNEQAMAYYGLAYMLTFPLSHFSNSLATTLFNKFASQKEIDRRVIRVNLVFVVVSVCAFIFLRQPIIHYLFSDTYLPVVEIMGPLAVAFGFSGLSKPYSLFLMAKSQGKIIRNITIVIPTSHILLNLFILPVYGLTGAVWTALFIYALDFFLYYFSYKKLIAKNN